MTQAKRPKTIAQMPVDQLECPHCRREAEARDRRRKGHCPGCGRRLVASAGKSEAEAWRRLYGKPPSELEQRLSKF